MHRITSISLTTLACFLAAACGSEDAGAGVKSPSSRPAAGGASGSGDTTGYGAPTQMLKLDDVPVRWPADGDTVYETCDVVVGLPNSSVEGQVAIITNGEAVAAGQKVTAGDGVQLLKKGLAYGQVKLPRGKCTVVAQVLDGDGMSRGAEWSSSLTYTVQPDPPSLRAWFIEPEDGATVPAKFKVKFGVEGMELVPKETQREFKTKGHHHILINLDAAAPGIQIPANETNIHYGGGQSESELELAPGKYKLTMQFGDADHRSYGARMAHTINITVQ